MEEESTGRGSGVDRVCQASELNSLFLELADEIDKLLNASSQPIQFPNHKGVPGTKAFSSLSKTDAFHSASARPVFEDLLAASLLKSIGLQLKVLILS